MNSLKEKVKVAKLEIKCLNTKIKELTNTEGSVLDPSLHQDLSEVLTTSPDVIFP